jgi:hypothetical protein
MIDSDWRWLAGGMALLVLYWIGSAATEMGTRWHRQGRSPTRGVDRGDRAQSTPPKPEKTS